MNPIEFTHLSWKSIPISFDNCFLSIVSYELWVTDLLPVLEIDLVGLS